MTGEVAAEICTPCGRVSLEQRGFCICCGSRDVALGNVGGIGTLWSQSMIYRPPSTEDDKAEPYIIGLVKLDVGPRIMTVIPQGLQMNDRVIVDRPTMESAPTARIASAEVRRESSWISDV